ncbi:MAG: discoidin domain-containing protein [Verrucomicrobiota bacterium]
MKKNGRLLGMIYLLTGVYTTASDAANLKVLKKIYQTENARIDAEYQHQLKPLHNKYYSSLAKIIRHTKSTGDLEGLAEVKAEEKRFLEEKSIPQLSLATNSSSLVHQAQHGFNQAKAKLTVQFDREKTSLLQKYIKRLESLKNDYVKKENLEQGFAVKAEMEDAGKAYAALEEKIDQTRSMIVKKGEVVEKKKAKPADELSWISEEATYTVSSVYADYHPLPTLLNGEKEPLHGQYSFCTLEQEPDSHIIIDLKRIKKVKKIFIVNRLTPEIYDRAETLTAWFSKTKSFKDEAIWNAEKGQEDWTIDLEEFVKARYIKLGITDNQHFHLAYVKVFGSELRPRR